MIEVVPSLLSQTEAEFREKLSRVKDLVDWVHVDVMDGQLVSEHCWAEPEIIQSLLPAPAFGVHLMVKHPEDYLLSWVTAGAARCTQGTRNK